MDQRVSDYGKSTKKLTNNEFNLFILIGYYYYCYFLLHSMKTKFGTNVIRSCTQVKNIIYTQLVAACVLVAFGFNGFQPSSSVII